MLKKLVQSKPSEEFIEIFSLVLDAKEDNTLFHALGSFGLVSKKTTDPFHINEIKESDLSDMVEIYAGKDKKVRDNV
jgi:hypothetical protein